MVMSRRGAGVGWGSPLDDEIHKLVEMVTELGIEVEDILFNAVTALLGEGIHGAQKAPEAGRECEVRYQLAHQRGLDLILDERATPDQTRWIIELQEINRSFRRIAQHAVRIATQSLALQQPAEDVLVLVGGSMHLLEYVVEQTRIQLRNAIMFSTSRDRKFARRIRNDESELRRAYIVFETRMHDGIGAYPYLSFPMHQLLSISTRLVQIGGHCNEIANAVLYDPPSQH